MTEVSTELSLNNLSRRAVLLAAFIAMVLCASLLPMGAIASASASTTSAVKNVVSSVSLDGSSELPLVGSVGQVAVAAATGAPPVSIFSPDLTAVTLGAPGVTNAITLGGCGWAGFGCVFKIGKDVVLGFANCISADAAKLVLWNGTCSEALGDILADLGNLAMWAIGPTVTKVAQALARGIQTLALSWANWILNDELGGKNVVTSPVLSCQVAQGAQKAGNCKDAWFLGQYNVMRQIALFFLLPLFMLVVIQSVLKGSTYLLIRSTLVMLPVSIIGTVVAVFFAQLLLNLSDDFVDMITQYTQSTTAYSTNFTSSVGGMDTTKINYLAVFWMIILLFATIIIYVELLLRQLGVYMSAFFLPLAFSALVWPASAGFAKKILELLIGLIFSKVFIATAVSLGIAAFANVSTSQATIPGVQATATTSGFGSLISGTLIFCLAAFAGTKVIQISPAAMTAAEGRVMPTGNVWAKGQLTKLTMDRTGQLISWRNNNRSGGGGFRSQTKPSGVALPAAQPRARAQSGQGSTAPAPPTTRRIRP